MATVVVVAAATAAAVVTECLTSVQAFRSRTGVRKLPSIDQFHVLTFRIRS